MAASSSISRTSSIFIRNFCKAAKSLNNISHSFPLPSSASSSSSKSSNFFFQQTRISTPHRLRREALLLNTLHPIHSATAAACLVSKLPTEVSSSNDETSSYNMPTQNAGILLKYVIHPMTYVGPITLVALQNLSNIIVFRSMGHFA
ncbi:hypothetical protein MKX01_000649 [Papaver californicum]|nr:hypothetical protein MKX01_000649 [Papaver californicum]